MKKFFEWSLKSKNKMKLYKEEKNIRILFLIEFFQEVVFTQEKINLA